MTRPLDDRTADALLGGRAVEGEPELSAFVADLTALTEAAPTPSPALAELLEHGLVGVAAPVTAPPAVRRPWATAPLWARFVTAGALALAAVLSAAAANALPGRAQNAVADVVGWVTPVDLPHADDNGPAPAPSPSSTPARELQDTPSTTSGTPEPGDSGASSSDDGTTGGAGATDDGSASSGDGTTGGSGDGSTGGSGDGTTGGGSVPGGSDESSPSPTPGSDETSAPDQSPTPSDGGTSDSS